MKYLFFDVETNGLAKNINIPAKHTSNWPRLVRLSWLLTDEEKLIEINDIFIRPDGWTISERVAKIHGITTEIAEERGVELISALTGFVLAANSADAFIAHNILFDQRVIEAEFIRCHLANSFTGKKTICTMRSTTDYCKMPGRYGNYKWPKLGELYKTVFQKTIEEDLGDPHDSQVDVRAVAKCYFKLKELGVLK